MPNGKPGDHPLTDILQHKLEVYSTHADRLVREIVSLADEKTRRELGDRLYQGYNPYGSPDIQKLERELAELRSRLTAEGRDRGFESPSD